MLIAVFAGVTAGSVPAAMPESQLAATTLLTARALRADVSGRYRGSPARRLVVTEATSLGVVDSVTLVTDWLAEPRLVSAANGVYFAICTARARCPYPARSAASRVSAFLPRRMALELAARMFAETSASLVVVSLPTERPTWVVFERDEFSRDADAEAVLRRLRGDGGGDETLLGLVDRLTGSRLYAPLPILPPPPDTIVAAHVTGSRA